MKAYFYPPLSVEDGKLVLNPYSKNFIESLMPYYEFDIHHTKNYALFDLLMNVLSSEIYFFNWVDNIGHKRFSFVQFIVFYLSLTIIRLRKKKIIWVFHNIHPHKGENWITKRLNNMMMKSSNCVITHSSEAEIYLNSRGVNKVLFTHHPIEKDNTYSYGSSAEKKEIDFLIWGTIEPYKGVKEFLIYCNENREKTSQWKIKIIGRCKDINYEKQLKELINGKVIFENRKIEFNELAQLILKTKYVLFPYISNSVSSSGVLMDSISMNATILGPNKGAFSDLASEGISYTYDTFNDLSAFIEADMKIEPQKVISFINKNTWKYFGIKVNKYISEVNDGTE